LFGDAYHNQQNYLLCTVLASGTMIFTFLGSSVEDKILGVSNGLQRALLRNMQFDRMAALVDTLKSLICLGAVSDITLRQPCWQTTPRTGADLPAVVICLPMTCAVALLPCCPAALLPCCSAAELDFNCCCPPAVCQW
jgi:hypothetical protein